MFCSLRPWRSALVTSAQPRAECLSLTDTPRSFSSCTLCCLYCVSQSLPDGSENHPPPERNASASHLVRNCATVYPLLITWHHRLNLFIFIAHTLYSSFPRKLTDLHPPFFVILVGIIVSLRGLFQSLPELRIFPIPSFLVALVSFSIFRIIHCPPVLRQSPR